MNKKYKLIFLKSLLLSGVITSYFNSDIDLGIIKKSLEPPYNDFIITNKLNDEETRLYEEETKKLTLFLTELVFINSTFIFIDDDKIKVYKKKELNPFI